jgi:hypothetical protein
MQTPRDTPTRPHRRLTPGTMRLSQPGGRAFFQRTAANGLQKQLFGLSCAAPLIRALLELAIKPSIPIHAAPSRSRSARMISLTLTVERRRSRRIFARASKSSAPSRSASRRISRCSASADRPCAAARCFSDRTISALTFRTVSWFIECLQIIVFIACKMHADGRIGNRSAAAARGAPPLSRRRSRKKAAASESSPQTRRCGPSAQASPDASSSVAILK